MRKRKIMVLFMVVSILIGALMAFKASIVVKADDDKKFIEQPANLAIDDDSTLSGDFISFKMNFKAEKLQILSNGTISEEISKDELIYQLKDGVYTYYVFFMADQSIDPIKIQPKKIRVFLNADSDFIDSDEFTVTKDYIFTLQPSDSEIDTDAKYYTTTCTVEYEVNFIPLKIEIWSDTEIIKTEENPDNWVRSYEIEADPKNEPDAIKKKKYRVYYTEDDYIDSNEFTVTKEYCFKKHPLTSIDLSDNGNNSAYFDYEVNFKPKKAQLLSDGKVIEEYDYTYSNSGTKYNYLDNKGKYSVVADPITKDKEAPKYQFRMYYTDEYYIDSTAFTITKDYRFETNPKSIEVESKEEQGTISWSVNFDWNYIEIFSDSKVIQSYSNKGSDKFLAETPYIYVDPDISPKKKFVRVYHKKGYVDSELFTVTKHYKFTVQPQSVTIPVDSEDDEVKVSFAMNFYPYKVELYSDGELVTFSDSDLDYELSLMIKPDSVTKPSDMTIRVYWSENEYVDSDTFTVIKQNDNIEDIPSDQSEETDVKDNICLGDINGDGEINAKDVTMLRRFLAGGWNVEIEKTNSDLNRDGEINAKDVTMLRRYLAGGWGVTLE